MFKLSLWLKFIFITVIAHEGMLKRRAFESHVAEMTGDLRDETVHTADNDTTTEEEHEERDQLLEGDIDERAESEDENEESAENEIEEEEGAPFEKATRNPRIRYKLRSHESIMGGRKISIAELPYLAILRVVKDQGPIFCTSSIINSLWVLSAAHCIGHVTDPRRVEVIAGQTDMRTQDRAGTTQRRKAVQLVVNPAFHRRHSPGNGDLALVRVEKPFKLDGAYVSSIKIRGEPWFTPSRNANCTSAGWGRERFYERNMGPLATFRSVATHGPSSCPCVSAARKKRVICLERNRGEGICKGDSGGPLICDGELVGVAHVLYPTPTLCIQALAGRPECGVPGWIDIYMYTCPYLDWMRSYVGEAVPKQPVLCGGLDFASNCSRGNLLLVIISISLILLS